MKNKKHNFANGYLIVYGTWGKDYKIPADREDEFDYDCERYDKNTSTYILNKWAKYILTDL